MLPMSLTKHHNLLWVTLKMKLQPLVELSLILILASNSKGEVWTVNVTKTINATLGENVTIPCMFEYPQEYNTKNVKLQWKIRRKSNFRSYDKSQYSIFIFHQNETFVEDKYRGKTKLIGNSNDGNCSLKIFNIMDSEENIYLRLLAGDNYSFIKSPVSIYVSGATPVIINPVDENELMSPAMYATIFVPVAAALIIIFVIGFVFFRHRRAQSFTREESGYYVNFSRASSTQAKRKELCKKQDNNELPELKVFDEPVYINVEAPAGQMDQHMDHTENIYANMDHPR